MTLARLGHQCEAEWNWPGSDDKVIYFGQGRTSKNRPSWPETPFAAIGHSLWSHPTSFLQSMLSIRVNWTNTSGRMESGWKEYGWISRSSQKVRNNVDVPVWPLTNAPTRDILYSWSTVGTNRVRPSLTIQWHWTSNVECILAGSNDIVPTRTSNVWYI
jgi:hypothetical protein